MSTVIFSQHSFIFRRVGRRNKFSKLFLGFSEVSYTRCSVRFCNFSTLFFITSYCGIVHNFSTGFRHVFNNFFGDRTIEGFDGRIGSRGRTPLFRSVHNGLNDRNIAQERHVVLLGEGARTPVAEDVVTVFFNPLSCDSSRYLYIMYNFSSILLSL